MSVSRHGCRSTLNIEDKQQVAIMLSFFVISSNYEKEGALEGFNSQSVHAGKSAHVLVMFPF